MIAVAAADGGPAADAPAGEEAQTRADAAAAEAQPSADAQARAGE